MQEGGEDRERATRTWEGVERAEIGCVLVYNKERIGKVMERRSRIDVSRKTYLSHRGCRCRCSDWASDDDGRSSSFEGGALVVRERRMLSGTCVGVRVP
jgi:hypothetical protein